MLVWYRDPADCMNRKMFIVENFAPRFYVKGNRIGAIKRKFSYNGRDVAAKSYIKRSYIDPKIKMNLWHEPVTCIETHISSDVTPLREWMFGRKNTYQAKILLPRTFLITTGVRAPFTAPHDGRINWTEFQPKPGLDLVSRVEFADIETDNRDGNFSNVSDPYHPITEYSWIDSYNPWQMNSLVWHPKFRNYKRPKVFRKTYRYEYFERDVPWLIYAFPNEQQMLYYLGKSFATQRDPDVWTGWNFNYFDSSYIVSRMRRLGINPRILSPLCTYVDEHGIAARNAQIVANGKKRVHIPGRVSLDMLDLYKTHTRIGGQKESYELDYIGFIEAKLRKIVHEGNVGEFWYNHLLESLRYNARDVELLFVINYIHNLFETYDLYRKETGCLWNDVVSPAIYMGTDQTRAANSMGFALPSTYIPPKKKKGNFQGANVLDQKAGYHWCMLAFDLKSMYLNIIDQWNISPDAFKFDIRDFQVEDFDDLDYMPGCMAGAWYIWTPNGLTWDRDVDGFARERVRYYQMKRSTIRDEASDVLERKGPEDILFKSLDLRQKAYKTFSLVFWGIFGHEGSELFWLPMAEAVIQTERSIIERSVNFIEDPALARMVRRKFRIKQKVRLIVKYGDTDSVYTVVEFVGLPREDYDWDLVTKISDFISFKLTESYREHATLWNCKLSKMLIRCEDVADAYYSTLTKKKVGGKKRYIKHIVRILLQEKGKERWIDADKLEIKGFEGKKSDNALFAKEILKEVYGMIVPDFDIPGIGEYLRGQKKKFFSKGFPIEEIAISKGINQPLEDYGRITKSGNIGSIPPQVRAVIYMNTHFKLNHKRGKIFFLYVNRTPKIFPRTDVVAFRRPHEIPKGFIPDYELIWKKQIITKIDTLFSAVGIKYGEIIEGRRQATLSSFGGKK